MSDFCGKHIHFETAVFDEMRILRSEQAALRSDITDAIKAWREESKMIREILQGAFSLEGDGLIARVNIALTEGARINKEFAAYKKIAWGMISSVLLGAGLFILSLITHSATIVKNVP